MTLFEVPTRPGRTQDKNIAGKVKAPTRKSTAVTLKGSDSMLNRINQIQATVETNLGKYHEQYQVIREEEVLHDFITDCIGNGYISIDTETDGLDPLQNTLAGICPYTYGQKGSYIPVNHFSYVTGMKVANQLPIEFIVKEFNRLLAKKPDIDMFNAKFDIRFLRANGLKDIYCTWDGYLASRILNENEEHKNLKHLHNKYCLDGKGDAFRFDDLFKGIPFTYIPINTGYLYAAHDPVITTELCDYQRKYLREDTDRQDIKDMYWVFKNIEMPCISVVADMEDNGILFDTEYAQELSEKYNILLEEKKTHFYELCNMYDKEITEYKVKNPNHKLDTPIGIGSSTQIAILLYDVLGIESPDKKNPRGTGVDILSKIDNPIAQAVLDYREIQKLLSTYIDKLPDCVNPKDGRIHCSFNQYGADTGRFSSSDPNLQNIPSHNKDIRKMFVASPGYVLMSSDYSQQEPKVMTQMCGDKKMLDAYRHGKDLYAQIASIAFNTEYENCLEFRPDGTTNKEGKERRSSAKSILLGILYGRGINSVAEQLHTTKQKAQQIQDKIFKGFPAIPKFEQDSKNMALELGYVTTLWGRKRRLPDLGLEEFVFSWKDGTPPDDDLLDFDTELVFDEDGIPKPMDYEVPEDIKQYYLKKLRKAWGSQKRTIFEEASKEGIKILDNGAKIADADRQVVNARIQGSAADMSKLAMIKVGNDAKLKELGFRLLIPVHDELIAECPQETAKEASQRFAQLMSEAASSKLTVPISCDVEITKEWYGERIEL